MEILNKITLKKELERPEKVKPVFLRARKQGNFGMSEALWELLQQPTHVEFRYDGLKLLYITRSDSESGFRITTSLKGKNYAFSAKPVIDRFFTSDGRYVVFTEPLVVDGEALFQIKL